MKEVCINALVACVMDTVGLSRLLTALGAMVVSFGVNDWAQLVAYSVSIVAGCMAIRHYATVTKLNQVKLQRQLERKEKECR